MNWMTRCAQRFVARLQLTADEVAESDRGDVPGWVLVTVMSAGLVTALWVIADAQLGAILSRAINSVTK